MRYTSLLLLCLAAWLAGGFAALHQQPAQAQTVPGSIWTPATNLSNSVGTSKDPAILADPYGSLHVFWSEDITNQPLQEGLSPQPGNSIVYRRLRAGVWTDTIDLFYGGESGRLENPSAVIDAQGQIWLAWQDYGVLSVSHAPATETTRLNAWAKPFKYTGVPPYGAIDPHTFELLALSDSIVAVYSISAADAPGIYIQTVSSDNAALPIQVWGGASGLAARRMAAAVDGRGRIHLVWEVAQRPSMGVFEVRYASSEDGGLTWSDSRLVARGTNEEDSVALANPWVFARGDDEIHLQWAQGSQAYRHHQYSTNGGNTWSPAQQIWPNLFSETGSRAVALDSQSRLYWADVLRYPNGAYLMRWTGNEWQYPELFYLMQQDHTEALGDRASVHNLRMAVAQGNELHVVFIDHLRAEIWYTQRTLPAEHVNPVPPPTPAPTPTIQPTAPPSVSADSTGVETTPRLLPAEPLEIDNLASRPGTALLAGVIPVLLLVGALAVWRLKKR